VEAQNNALEVFMRIHFFGWHSKTTARNILNVIVVLEQKRFCFLSGIYSQAVLRHKTSCGEAKVVLFL
jgi:hypothetical protein